MINILKENQFFGGIALLTGEPVKETAEVFENSELILINKKDFKILLREKPEIAESISKTICERRDKEELSEEKKEEENTFTKSQLLDKIKKLFSI